MIVLGPNFIPIEDSSANPPVTEPVAVNNHGEIAGTKILADGTEVGFFLGAHGYVDIVAPGSSFTAVVGLNDRDQMIGQDSTGSFLYSGGSFTHPSIPSVTDPVFTDLSSTGRIVGIFTDSGRQHGFAANNNNTKIFNFPLATDTTVEGTNDLGQVVGRYSLRTDTGSSGYIFQSNHFTSIDVPDALSTNAVDLNDWGQVVGTFTTEGNFALNGNPTTHSFIYADGNYYTVDGPIGVQPGSLVISGINNLGQIVGTYQTLSDGNLHGYAATLGEHFSYDVSYFDHPSAVAPYGTQIVNSNVAGDFVGQYSDSSAFSGHSFASIGGTIIEIAPAATAQGTSAADINDLGQIAGTYTAADGSLHGFLYDGGSYTTLDDPNANPGTTNITGMNNAGQLVGYYMAADGQHEFVYSASAGFSDLDLSGLGAQGPIIALDINDFGQIAGSYFDVTDNTYHGFILSNGVYTAIADPDAGSTGSGVVSINNAGQAAGFFQDDGGKFHPFVYSGGAYSTVDLPNSGGANGISNSGTVAGSDNDGTTHSGFLASISGATLVPVLASPPPVITNVVWSMGFSGDFEDAPNWSTDTVPNAANNVVISRAAAVTVTQHADHVVNNIRIGSINNDSATLQVVNATLQVDGGKISVPGTLELSSTIASGASLLIGRSTVMQGGCGCEPDVVLGAPVFAIPGDAGPVTIGTVDGLTAVARLTSSAYIAGSGRIGDGMMQLVNVGQIEAQGGTLTIDTGANGITNGGELDATPGATLSVESHLNNFGLLLALSEPGMGGSTINIDASLNNYNFLDARADSSINVDAAVKNYGRMFSEGSLTVSGALYNNGVADILANGGSIDITGTVTNHGTMEADDGGSITVHGLVKNTGPLIANGSTITIDTLQGGTASIIDDGTLDFGGRSNTAVDFSGGAGGNLILEDSGAFKGSISGFDDTDMVTLKDLLIGADTRLSYNNGLLRVVDSGGIEAKLDFGSGYTISNFTLGHDTDGHVTIEHHV